MRTYEHTLEARGGVPTLVFVGEAGYGQSTSGYFSSTLFFERRSKDTFTLPSSLLGKR